MPDVLVFGIEIAGVPVVIAGCVEEPWLPVLSRENGCPVPLHQRTDARKYERGTNE